MSLSDKINSWANSPKGQAKIQQKLKEYTEKGIATANGSTVPNNLLETVNKFIEVLHNTAQSFDLPDSVMAHIENIKCSSPLWNGDGWEVSMYFDGDLHRDSLMPEKYDGVDNIIAIFNNGYEENEKINYVWGEWHGAYIHGLTGRTGLHFIQQAVDSFNKDYGVKHNISVNISPIYK